MARILIEKLKDTDCNAIIIIVLHSRIQFVYMPFWIKRTYIHWQDKISHDCYMMNDNYYNFES